MLRVLIATGLACLVLHQEELSGQTAADVGADEQIGDFYFVRSADDLGDSDRGFILVFDEDPAEGNPSLNWGCMADGLNVILNLSQFFGGDDNSDIYVRHRFDQGAAGREDWRLLTGNETARIGMDRVDSFTEAALSAQTVILEALDPLDGDTTRFTFPLSGLGEALTRLTCRGP